MRRRFFLAVLLGLLVTGCSGSDGAPPPTTLPPAVLPGTVDGGPRLPSVTVATLNLLHGLFCPEGSDDCHAPARLEVAAVHLEQAGCPELVGLQEVGPRQAELIPAWLEGFCGGRYRAVWAGEVGIDREMVLTTLPLADAGLLDLAGFPWEAVWVRAQTEEGTIDFVTAHFASSSNDPACDSDICPSACPEGMQTNQCNAVEVAAFFADGRADLTVVAGDLNATPGGGTPNTLLAAGFADAWVAAGNPPCDAATGAGCTGGGPGSSTALGGLDSAAGPGFAERIDYVLVRPAAHCALQVQAGALGAAPLGRPIDGMFWASDHAGVLARLACGPAG